MATMQLQNNLHRQVECALQCVPQAKHAEVLQNGFYLENSTAKNNTPVPGKMVLMDKNSRNHIMIYSTDLNIGDDACNWEYSLVPDDPPRNNKLVEVAELLDGTNVQVDGDCDTSYLTKGTTYEVVYVVMMNMDSYGWSNSVTLKFVDPKGKVTKHKVRLDGMPVNTWEYVRVGVFKNDADPAAGKVQFSLTEVDSGEQKKGLIVKGVAIRPKV